MLEVIIRTIKCAIVKFKKRDGKLRNTSVLKNIY